jgi:uncharacterized protein with GYD domain
MAGLLRGVDGGMGANESDAITPDGAWIADQGRVDGHQAAPWPEMQQITSLEGAIYQTGYFQGVLQAFYDRGLALPHMHRLMDDLRAQEDELKVMWESERGEVPKVVGTELVRLAPTLYLGQVEWTPEAKQKLVRKPQDRGRLFDELVESIEGDVIATYYSVGEWTAFVIFETPNIESASAVELAVVNAGHVKRAKVTPLLTQDQFLDALYGAKELKYEPPGF